MPFSINLTKKIDPGKVATAADGTSERSQRNPMAAGPRIFAGVYLSLFGIVFWLQTIILAVEYKDANWFDIAAVSSFIYLFFPTLGIAAIFASYGICAIFVDMLWRHVALGRVTLIVGFISTAAISYAVSAGVVGTNHNAYMISPNILLSEMTKSQYCSPDGEGCKRLPILTSISNLRQVSRLRFGVADLIHSCHSDVFVEPPATTERKRFCLALTPMPSLGQPGPRLSSNAECCRAQEALEQDLQGYLKEPTNRSLSGRLFAALLGVKIFFFLSLFAGGLLLITHEHVFDSKYQEEKQRLVPSITILALVLIVFPLIYLANGQGQDALYGTANRPTNRGLAPYLAVLAGAAALLIFLFFYGRRGRKFGQAATAIGAALFGSVLLKYEEILSIVVSFLGAGVGWPTIAGMFFVSLLAVAIAAASGIFHSTVSERKR